MGWDGMGWGTGAKGCYLNSINSSSLFSSKSSILLDDEFSEERDDQAVLLPYLRPYFSTFIFLYLFVQRRFGFGIYPL